MLVGIVGFVLLDGWFEYVWLMAFWLVCLRLYDLYGLRWVALVCVGCLCWVFVFWGLFGLIFVLCRMGAD